jgi:phosphoribosylaminoimidazole-succinocarboxamide synthase
VVTRNRLAGSTAKKLGLEEGTSIAEPLVEFYYKDDALGDPFLSDDQALLMKAVKARGELDELREKALRVNKVLRELFQKIGIELIDFKLEFGRLADGTVILADEVTPDTCRLWDLKSGEKMDKDRFRRDLGRVEESYAEVLKRLQGAV